MTEDDSMQPEQAQGALDTVENMRTAGLKRAVAPRWYGIGISSIVAIGFGLYAQKDPGSTPALVIALGTALLVTASRNKIGVLGKSIPDTRSGIWGLVALVAFLIAMFFGGIIIRRSYDLAWVPVVTGLVAGGTLFLLSESERRHHLPKSDDPVRI